MFTKRKSLLAAGGVSGLCLLVMASSAGAAAPAKAPSLSCGSVVTTDVRLGHDLVDCPVHGLVVGASGITIDLNGHTIDGGGPFESLSGIFNETYTGVTVRNGEIRDFSRGVEGYQAHGGTYSRLDVSASIEGISLHDSDDSVVDRGGCITTARASCCSGPIGSRSPGPPSRATTRTAPPMTTQPGTGTSTTRSAATSSTGCRQAAVMMP